MSIPEHDPWHYAKSNGVTYITPEDIGDAVMAGADRLELSVTVLRALSMRQCEDATLCAFVAVDCYENPRSADEVEP